MADFKSRARRLGMKAAERVMQNEKVMSAAFKAFQQAQSGKAALDRLGDGVLHQLGFAARGDYKALGKRLSALKRKLRELSVKLDGLA
ncbi:MAG TPA: hypothetical protein VMB50_20205 [Myxococcales bacterium]|nr:hypothetical protein [Myxococcales bacterium]